MCKEKQELFENFFKAEKKLLKQLRLQIQAIMSGDNDFGRFDCRIHAAKQQKDDAARAYNAHVCNHACGSPFNLTLSNAMCAAQ